MGWKYRITVGVMGALALGAAAASADVLDTLAARESLAGTFEQTVTSGDGLAPQTSRGRFALRRPGAFRWEITAPDRQLLIVDGVSLWQYDFDLQTALRRPLPEDDTSPLQLLTTDRSDLKARYDVVETAGSVTLTPLGENPYFQSLKVVGDPDSALQLTIRDTLDQVIVIRLMPDANTEVNDTLFQFSPPPGTQWLEGGPDEPRAVAP